MIDQLSSLLDDRTVPDDPIGEPGMPWRCADLPGRAPRSAVTWFGRGFLAAGIAMLPWLIFLAGTLPSATRAEHWSTAWVGLDGMEALGLLITGAALICRCSWLCLPAAMTATLLVADAWFDVTTSAPGPALMTAVAMAAFAELPAASLCAVLAMRNIRAVSGPATADLSPGYSTSSRMRSIRSSLSRSSLT